MIRLGAHKFSFLRKGNLWVAKLGHNLMQKRCFYLYSTFTLWHKIRKPCAMISIFKAFFKLFKVSHQCVHTNLFSKDFWNFSGRILNSFSWVDEDLHCELLPLFQPTLLSEKCRMWFSHPLHFCRGEFRVGFFLHPTLASNVEGRMQVETFYTL